MVVSVYRDLIQYKDTQGDMVSRLSNINLHEVFKPLIDEYASKDMATFNGMMYFILRVYSYESDELVLGIDFLKLKEKIFNDVGLDRDLHYANVILLQCQAFARTVSNYLELQEDEDFMHYMTLKDAYMQQLHFARIVPHDAKYKCAEHAGEIRKLKNDFEEKMKQKFGDKIPEGERQKVASAVPEAKKKKPGVFMGMEQFSK